MIIPLTSTTVATNGADETAGSKPKRDSINGNIAPIKLPNKTIDNKLNAITKAVKKDCSSIYPFAVKSQTKRVTNPKIPINIPNTNPELSSLKNTFSNHRFNIIRGQRTNNKCGRLGPELPPLDIINGTKNDKKTILESSSSYCPIVSAVNI